MLYEKNHLLYHIFTKTHLCVRGVKFGPDDSRWHGSSLQRKLNICTRYIPPAWIYSRTNRCTPQVGSGLYEQGDNCVNHFIVRNYTKYQCDLIQAFIVPAFLILSWLHGCPDNIVTLFFLTRWLVITFFGRVVCFFTCFWFGFFSFVCFFLLICPAIQRQYRPISQSIDEFVIQILNFAHSRKMIIWSALKFAHVTTAKLSWHVQICDLIWPSELW